MIGAYRLDWFGSQDVVELCGITYRQLDYWIRQKYITPEIQQANGSGTAVIGTGVTVAIPRGHVGNMYVRSSLGVKKQITLANGTGIIDSGYRGEIMAVLQNNSQKMQTIKRGERIVQVVVSPVNTTQWKRSPTHVAAPTERGTGAYGSTGA